MTGDALGVVERGLAVLERTAVCDLIERTSNELAPWVLVPANDKYAARIAILKTLCERIEEAL